MHNPSPSQGENAIEPSLFDAYYYKHSCGEPYQRSQAWLDLFNHVADRIVADIQPATVLDAGCALGILVESLRDRGVAAFGIDISDYAIQHVRADMAPYCTVASVAEPFPQRYDLIVCIEVLEHMSPNEAEKALANLCQYADDILFSSSPLDYEEITHFNVRQPEYWAAQFARHGFKRDLDFDGSFLTPWAMRFQRQKSSQHDTVRAYERHLWPLRKENHDLRHGAVQMRQQLAEQAQEVALLRQQIATQAQQVQQLTATLAQANDRPPTQQLLIISHDVIGKKMAGPGIRYYHMARALSQHIDVVLAIPDESPPDFQVQNRDSHSGDSHTLDIVRYQRRAWTTIAPYVQQAQICLFPSDAAHEFPELSQSQAYLIIDGYDPLMAEWLALGRSSPESRNASEQYHQQWQQRHAELTHQYQVGDFFICASERQRDWWIGLLEANGRINPANFGADPSLRSLIDVVPYGLPEQPPQKKNSVIKGVWQGIHDTDSLLLWGGGLWPWLDPITAIRAVAKVWEVRQDVKLVFPGTKHPNPMLDGMPTQNEDAYQTAQALGLLNKGVFFGDWVPYDAWADVLLECDLALTLHYDTVETRLAFRSRVLEYIWAGLPTIATRGDATSDIIQQYQIGTVVDYEDVDGVAQAILDALSMPRSRRDEPFQRAHAALSWERAVAPLVAFCQAPRRAADQRSRVENQTASEIGAIKQVLDQKQAQLHQVREEKEHWQNLVRAYEQGKFIRLMRWVKTNRPFAR